MSHWKTLSITIAVVFLVLLLAPQNGDALTQMFYRQDEYERLGKVVDSKKFGKTMLEVNGYLQLPVKIIPDPQARQVWPLRSPYTNTACVAYVAESRQSAGNTVEVTDYQTASVLLWGEFSEKVFELPNEPLLHLKDSYEDVESKRYWLTPIETREGSVIKHEWCLEPDKTYTLAIFDLGETLPSGQSFSALHFYFTDPIPEEQPARAEEKSCPPHYIRDAATGDCIRPISTTPSPPVPPLSRIWIFIRIALGFTIVGLVLLVVWYFRRWHKNR